MSAFLDQVNKARNLWLCENPGEEGRDQVTPFDQFLYSEPPITVRELQDQVHAFAEEVFGPEREDAAWKKLFEELGETIKNPEDPSEWADIFIILLDLAKMYGVDVGDASVAKMVINRTRVWTQSKTGVMQHVPGAVKEEPKPQYNACFEGGPLHGIHTLPGSPPTHHAPSGHEGPGCYAKTRVDIGAGRRKLHVYRWDPNLECPF